MRHSYILSFFNRCLSFPESQEPKPNRSARRVTYRRVRLQTLEDRTLPTVDTFTNALGGAWSLGSNWSLGAPPTSGEDAVVTPGSSETVTHASGTDSVNNLTSDGSLLISGGSIMVGAALSGEVQVTGSGQLDLTGTATLTSNTTIMLSGGATVDIPGNITNTGNTLTVTGSGSVILSGTLTGGTLNLTNGATLSGQAGTMSGVTLNGNMTVDNSSYLNITNGLTLNGTVDVGSESAGYGYLNFVGTQSLSGSGTVTFVNAYTTNSMELKTVGMTLTIGSGITVNGGVGYIGADPNLVGAAATKVVNQGTINANVGGDTIYLNATTFTNQGTIETNQGNLIFYNTMVGGTISDVAGGTIGGVAPITLNGVTVDGTIGIGANTSWTIMNGLTLNGTMTLGGTAGYANLEFSGSQTLGGNGNLVFDSSSTKDALWLPAGGTLTIGPNITVEGETAYIGYDLNLESGTIGNVVNQGTIDSNAGGTFYLTSATSWINQGTLETGGGGTLNLGTIGIGGSIQGSGGFLLGTLSGATITGNLQNATSSLTITNGLTLNGTLGLSNCYLDFSGTQTLGGTGTVQFAATGTTALVLKTSDTALTIGSNITVTGGTAYIGYDSNISISSSKVSVVNLGTIVSASGTLYLDAANGWTNQGLLQAIDGILDLMSPIGGNIYISTVSGSLEGSLSGAIFSGSLTLPYTTSLTITNGLTLNGAIILGGTGYSYLDFSGTQTLGGNGSITFASTNTSNALVLQTSGTTLTIGSGITISGYTGYIGYDPNLSTSASSVSIVCQGTINATGSGGTIYLDAPSSWINQGTLITSGGTLNVGSNIANPTINGSGGGSLTGTLNGATLTGSIAVGSGGGSLINLVVTNGLTLDGVLSLGYGFLNFTSTQMLSGTGMVTFTSKSTTSSLILQTSGTTLTIGSGITINGQTGYVGYDPNAALSSSSVSVVNQGTINASVSGGVIYLDSPIAWTNEGILETTGGTLDFVASSISGTINASGGGKIAGTLNNATLTGAPTIDGNSSLIILNGLTLNGTLTLGDSTGYGYLNFSGSQTLGGTGTVTFGSSSTTNALVLQISNTTLTIGPGITINGQNGTVGYGSSTYGSYSVSVVNEGIIDASVSGGTICLQALNSWINQGTLEAAGGTLYLESNITDPTINGSAGSKIEGTLVGATLTGSFTVDANNYLTITNGLTLDGILNLGDSGGYGALDFSGTQTLGGNGTVIFGSNNSYNSLVLQNFFTTLTIGSGITIQGKTGYVGCDPLLTISFPEVDVINLGTINANVSGGIIYIFSLDSWINQGLLEASGGTLNIQYNVTGGTITGSGGGKLIGTGPLIGVTLTGTLTVDSKSTLSITSGLTVNGTLTLGDNSGYGYLSFSGTQTLGGSGTVVFSSGELAVNTAGTTLTIGSGITVRGSYGLIGGSASVTVINQGTIQEDVNYGSITVEANNGFTNSGSLNAILSTINIESTSVVNSGTISLSSAGSLSINCPFTQSTAGSFNVVLGGSTSGLYGHAAIGGTAALNGTLNISEANGFTPGAGNIFTIFTYTSATSQFSNYSGLILGTSVELQPTYNPGSLTLTTQTTTSTILTSSNSPTSFGHPLTLAATVAAVVTGSGTLTATVSFFSNGVVIATVPVNTSDVATYITTDLPIGTDSLTAVYSGDANDLPGTSTVLTEIVDQDGTTLLVNSLPNPTVYDETTTFTATVSPVDLAAGTPTGTATFYDDLAPLGTENLVNGSATFTTSSLAVGTHSITATYSGDSDFLPSTSSAIFETVQAAASPIVSVVINNGQQQRSMLTSIMVDFTGVVDPTALAFAFTLTRVGLPNGEAGDNATPGTITVTTSSDASGNTIATLTFSGANTEAGSLGDGNWTLTIDAAQITAGGLPMASDYVQPDIKRLFGDINGTGTVDSTDLGIFGTTFGLTLTSPAFIAGFDSDGNGIIDSTDLGAVGTRFGLTI